MKRALDLRSVIANFATTQKKELDLNSTVAKFTTVQIGES
jgi:hypothetical protein